MGDDSPSEGETPPAPISAPTSAPNSAPTSAPISAPTSAPGSAPGSATSISRRVLLGRESNRGLKCAITAAVGAAPCASSVGIAGAAAGAALECSTLEVSSGLMWPLSARRPASRLK